MNHIELLCPAKDLETGMAAINCGADAVYIGPPKFGARKSAGNSLEDIRDLVNYAHKYWARVYVTVNTLLYDKEFPDAERLINKLYEIGVDAIIIQDTGLLELDLPPIPLFASTQMHNHTPERVAFLEKVGFQRAILARELSLTQIQEIQSATNIELETFIHGALCVSYSGQCYMSYAIGGRSGNRGQCAQPCRMKYSLVDANGTLIADQRYLLSLRDLNLSNSLAELVDAGVCSFKIEGRLKNKAYVMNVVSHYRQLLDNILNDRGKRASSSGKVTPDFSPDPVKTFNRGYTSYFLHGRDANITAPDSPKSIGEPLGKIASINKNIITLADNAPSLNPGDGLCYFDANKELQGTSVNAVNGNTIRIEKTQGLLPGTAIFRNHDHKFITQLNKSHPERKIQVHISLEETPDGVRLVVVDEDQCTAEAKISTDQVPADFPEKSLAIINRQLHKLGGTAFVCTQVECNVNLIPFLPASVLNQLRRTAIEQLATVRIREMPRKQCKLFPNNDPYPTKVLTFQGNILNQKAAAFYRRHGVERFEDAAEKGASMLGRKIMTTKHCLRYEFNACPLQENHSPAAEPWKLIDENGNEYPLQFNCADCEMEIYFHKLPE
jgi:23S rRNA 5-hydroxycytidine C2501 synthase